MGRDQLIGSLLLIASIVVVLAYGYLLFFCSETIAILLLKLTGFIAVLGVFGILAWIGYTLATTPSPKPIEDIEKELEGEELRDEREHER